MARFEAAGYRGDYDVELMGEDMETTDYQQLIRASISAARELLRPAS